MTNPTDDLKKSLGNVIKTLRKQYGQSQDELAELLGIDRGNVSRYENGKQNIEMDKVMQIAKIYGTPVSEMFKQAEECNVCLAPDIKGKVPLISWVQAGNWQEISLQVEPHELVYIETTYRARRFTYALRIVGESMSPKFPEGAIIIVEPEEPVFNKAFVIVRQNGNEATFKQYIEDGGVKLLKPYNTQYPIMTMAPDAVICGVVKRMEIDV